MKIIRFAQIFLVLLFMIGCSNKLYPDLSSYDLEQFMDYKSSCTSSSQCRVIGFGVSPSCDANNFEGFIIYSTKMGEKNITRLKGLISESRGGYSDQTYGSGYQEVLEECQPYDVPVPEPVCLENVCRGRLIYYTN